MFVQVLLSGLMFAGVPSKKACLKERSGRSQILCLAKRKKLSSARAMLAIARDSGTDAAVRKGPAKNAAEEIGRLAATTPKIEVVLDELANADQPFDRAIGLRGYGMLFSLLRMGYGQGAKKDSPRFEKLVGSVSERCARALTHKDERVVRSALECLKQGRLNRFATDIVRVIHDHPDVQVKRQGYYALRGLYRISQRAKELRPLADVLRLAMPIKWKQADVGIRADICSILRGNIRAGETWPAESARLAIVAIGSKSSQARKKCEKLLEKAGGEAAAPPPGRNPNAKLGAGRDGGEADEEVSQCSPEKTQRRALF